LRAHWAYLKVVLRHKWFVLLASRQMGVPLWIAFIHDLSKFSPAEWNAYVHHFYNPDGTKRDTRDKSGAYNPVEQKEAFQLAWLHHQRNPHHWNAWASIGDYGELVWLPIPEVYLREMVCDWIAAGLAYSGKADPVGWYFVQQYKINMHEDSRRRLEELLQEYAPQAWAAIMQRDKSL